MKSARLLATALALAACTTVGPDYRPPETKVPDAFSSHGDGPATPAGAPLAAWWTAFRDPKLDALVARAIARNPDLRRAQAAVLEARALRGGAAAEALPTVDATGAITRRRTSETLAERFPGSPWSTLFETGFDASWEIDLFGGVRRSVEAADADVAARVEDRRAVLVTLLAEIARNYVDLRGAQRQAGIARRNLAAQEETLGLTRLRLDAGIATELDVARAQAQVHGTAAALPSLDAEARRALHALAVLVGEEPRALVADLSADAPLPSPPAEIPVGLPSDLLRRRPDVRRAERQLAAATARIGVATADLFPRFSLGAAFGLASAATGDILDVGSRTVSLGPSVRWPLLDFGRVRRAIDASDAVEQQAAAAYESAVLAALRDVEDALVSLAKDDARRKTLAAASDANQRAVDLALQVWREGRTDFLSVLQAQRDLFASQDALVRSERAVAADVVALYKALGGGWEAEIAAAPPPERGAPGRRTVDVTASPTR